MTQTQTIRTLYFTIRIQKTIPLDLDLESWLVKLLESQ